MSSKKDQAPHKNNGNMEGLGLFFWYIKLGHQVWTLNKFLPNVEQTNDSNLKQKSILTIHIIADSDTIYLSLGDYMRILYITFPLWRQYFVVTGMQGWYLDIPPVVFVGTA
jgi:hypothetical protein